jgi:urease accessory protein
MPALAHAHPGHATSSVAHGFSHPLSGIDHFLAMLAVGLWAGQLGGRARWQVPMAFLVVMLAGGILGMGGTSVPGVEQGILASILVLGVLVAAAIRLPLVISIAMVGMFALFHGAAHGTEMPVNATGLSYSVGFTIATAMLHLTGLGIGVITNLSHKARFVRIAGGAIAICALMFAVS